MQPTTPTEHTNEWRATEFKKFMKLLMQKAPPKYTPHLLILEKGGKDPIPYVSWKKKENVPTIQQATEWILQGGNIGVAGMCDDYLVNVDLDGKNADKKTLPQTLTTRSRSRIGIHGFYFTLEKENIPNIPTNDDGEVRCNGQYVVCAGSYVSTNPENVPLEFRNNVGYYTVEDKRTPSWIIYEDIPEFFRKTYEKRVKLEEENKTKPQTRPLNKNHSTVFDVQLRDIVLAEFGKVLNSGMRWGSIFHDSKTEKNMSLSKDEQLLHCWRHNVSHNALQALVVLSKYMTCLEAGTPHQKGGKSAIVGDNGSIFHAWLYAKQHGYIPLNDPIPTRGLHYIAKKHGIYNPKTKGKLPKWAYRQVLEIVRGEY